MDESTLTATLRSLAAEPVLHTSPSADARIRAHRLQRGRRVGIGVGVMCLAGVIGVVAVEAPQSSGRTGQSVGGAQWLHEVQDPSNPNHATTEFVTLPRTGGGQYAVYWQQDHLCLAFVTSTEPGSGGGSGCASVVPASTQPMTAANVGDEDAVMAVSVRSDVAKVAVRRLDGTRTEVTPVTASGFPYRAVVAMGRVVGLQAYDKEGRPLGALVPGPDAAQLRPVLATFACPVTTQSGFDVVLPELNDPKRCYGLAPTAMTLAPTTAHAVDDRTQGWIVAVTLSTNDQSAFADLTRRLAGQEAPKNQLAIVFEGKVFSAPTIEQAITGGWLPISGGAKPFTEREAKQLASMIGG